MPEEKKSKVKLLRKVSFLKDTKYDNIVFNLNDHRKKLYKILVVYSYLLRSIYKQYMYRHFRKDSPYVKDQLRYKYRSYRKLYSKSRRKYIIKYSFYKNKLNDYRDYLSKHSVTLFEFLSPMNVGFMASNFNGLFNKLISILNRIQKRKKPRRYRSRFKFRSRGKFSKFYLKSKSKSRKRFKSRKQFSNSFNPNTITTGKLMYVMRLMRRYIIRYRKLFKFTSSEERIYFNSIVFFNNLFSYNSALNCYYQFITLKKNNIYFLNFFNKYCNIILRRSVYQFNPFFFVNLHKLLGSYYINIRKGLIV